jgi:hypothetical protein
MSWPKRTEERTMNFVDRACIGSSLVLLIGALTGCPAPPRGCGGCTYKMASFTAVPTAAVESATLKASVKHVGACPQGTFPNDCTETISYEARCALGTTGTVTLPMLVDAAPTNPNRSAKLSVKLAGNPTPVVITGTVLPGAGSTTLPASPCPPPAIDPYVTLPNVN